MNSAGILQDDSNSFVSVCAGLSLTQIGGQNYSYAASDTVIFYAYDPTDASARYMWSWNNSYLGCGAS